MTELKPCPFCGGMPEIRDYWTSARVTCPACGVCTAVETMIDGKDFKERAARKWNTRVNE